MTRVAVVGIAFRLRGVKSGDDLRRVLSSDTTFAPLPPDRWDPDAFGAPPAARLLDDYELDFRAFRLPPAQVSRMHRMERAALSAMRDALVDAGRAQLGPWGERTMVHMAASTLGLDPSVDHLARVRLHEAEEALRAAGTALDEAARTAAFAALEAMAPPITVDSLMTTAGMTAGRVANAFDLGGGHLAYDAGGASSLAALAGAASALEERECDLAVVGAISPLVTATIVEAYRKRLLYSTSTRLDGGTLLGEGAVALVLERAEDAIARQQRIYAVLCGRGRAASGKRGPVTSAEDIVARAARSALDESRLSPGRIDYVEAQAAHLGELDEGEASALHAVYGEPGARELALASVTGSFGYLGAAAGLASVATACLALERGTRAGVVGTVQRVAVSSLGLGGIAHHAIFARPDEPVAPSSRQRIEQTIAIVGLGAVMPNAPDPAALWKLVLDGKDALTTISPERWDAPRFMAAAARGNPDAVRTTLAGQLATLVPDAALLRVAPASLPYIDGSVVLTAQACAQAIADAGLPTDGDPDRTGVVVGHLPLRSAEFAAERRALAARTAATVDRALEQANVTAATRARVSDALRARMLDGVPPLREETLDQMSSLPAASRVAARFDFRGDVLSVDAACASSLTALRQGVLALQRGELDTVVVAASAYNLVPEYYVALATLGALAKSGSRPFDGGDGMVPAEGAGAVVLRRLTDAKRDRQRVYAVVRAVALSSDGRGTALLAPSTRGQRRALERAYAQAGIAPAEIDLLEAHGTGTITGDAVELETYGAVFAARSGPPIQLGSVKANVGHLSSAAGMAGLIKSALALHHRVLPPARHSGQAAPTGPLTRGTLTIGTTTRDWPEPARGARVAGVSAFGLGGVNAHVVLEEHVSQERRRVARASSPHVRTASRLVTELSPLALPDGAPSLPKSAVLLVGAQGSPVRAAAAKILERAQVPHDCVESPERNTIDPTWGAVLDLRGLDAPTSTLDTVKRVTALGKLAYEAWERDGGRLVIASAMGGGLGLLFGDRVAEGGALAGFVKALRLELPKLGARLVDVDAEDEPAWLAATLLAELAAGGDRAEVGYFSRRRVVPVLRTAPLAVAAPPLHTLEADSVVLFSGGGRGVVFACAKALAERGVRVIVTGRQAPSSEPWIALDDAAFEATREPTLRALRSHDATLTPARFEALWSSRTQLRELHRNLASVAALPFSYRVLDVTDANAVRTLVDEIVREHGRIDGIVHGAMVERSRALPHKTDAQIEACVRTKVDGLEHLLAASEPHQPRFVIAFGSIAGRLGNRGQTDYAAANDAMARLLSRHGHQHPRMHCVTLEWTAWGAIGAAAQGRTLELLHQAGVQPIDPREGTSFFLEELSHGPEGQSIALVCAEAQAYEWPGVQRCRDASDRVPAVVDDRGQPLHPSEWPLVDARLPPDAEGRVVLTRTLDTSRDLFLAEHLVDGIAYLPAAFAVELLAEAASLATGGQPVREIRDLRLDGPLRLTERALTPQLRSTLKPSALQDERRVFTAEIAIAAGSSLVQPRAFATIVVGAGEDALAPLPIAPPSGKARESLFARMTAPLRLGRSFQQIEHVERTQDGARALLRLPDERALFASTSAPRLSTSPLLLDAAFQVASHIGALRPNGVIAIPVGFARVRFGAQPAAEGPIFAQALLTDDSDEQLVADVQLEQNGVVLLRVEQLRLRRLLAVSDARFS